MIASWLAHITGIDNGSGRPYLFLSGFVGDVGLLGVIGSVLRRHNCHVHRCFRLGRHPVEGTAYVVCRHHHPDDHLTHAHVVRAHLAALRRRDDGHNGPEAG